ncbi:MAG: GNAT family N-acetyltransferase [Microthrixaceae bacterium]
MGDQHTSTQPTIPAADTLEWHEAGSEDPDLKALDDEMAAQGMQRVRTLVQLHRPLPLGSNDRDGLAAITVRPFDPLTDREDLLAVNNAAFDWHPEQGNWDDRRLSDALAQPWVDTSGILVHDVPSTETRREGLPALDGFCWTRIHRGVEPEAVAAGLDAVGEIWVIGAHPAFHGTGLGRALVVAGLDHMSAQGPTSAMLYTEADNEPAMRLYAHMGFTAQSRRGGYRSVAQHT